MNEVLDLRWWGKKVNEYLEYACQAEARGNKVAAEMLFRKALFSEAFIHGDLNAIREYTTLTQPVYPELMVRESSHK